MRKRYKGERSSEDLTFLFIPGAGQGDFSFLSYVYRGLGRSWCCVGSTCTTLLFGELSWFCRIFAENWNYLRHYGTVTDVNICHQCSREQLPHIYSSKRMESMEDEEEPEVHQMQPITGSYQDDQFFVSLHHSKVFMYHILLIINREKE